MTANKTGEETRRHRPWWKKKRWWVAGLLVLWITGAYSVPRFPYLGHVFYTYPIDEEILIRGKPLSSWQDKHGRPNNNAIRYYKASAIAFPDFNACIDDQGAMNWRRLRFLEDLEVCAFWAARQFGDADKLLGWLKPADSNQRLNILKVDSILMRSYGVHGDGNRVNVSYFIPPMTARISRFAGYAERLLRPPNALVGSFNVRVTLDSTGNPLDVNSGYNLK